MFYQMFPFFLLQYLKTFEFFANLGGTTVQYTETSFDSSGKWGDPMHFLKSQGKFFFVISMNPFFTYF